MSTVKSEYKFKNREGVEFTLSLNPLTTNKFTLSSVDPFYLKYLRIGYDDDKTIKFIDPPGGPFLSIGTPFEDGAVITNITVDKGITITLE